MPPPSLKSTPPRSRGVLHPSSSGGLLSLLATTTTKRKQQARFRSVSSLLVGALFLLFLFNTDHYLSKLSFSHNYNPAAASSSSTGAQHVMEHPKSQDNVDYLSNLLESLDKNKRCNDADDPPEWRIPAAPATGDKISSSSSCECTDPTVPVERGTARWTGFHQSLVQQASDVVARRKEQKNQQTNTNMDVLLLGDSITERWMGTKFSGKVQAPEFRQVFEEYFDKSKSAKATLDGAPFGGSGDTAPELLWHLQNGVLADGIQPRSVLLLIGTNDIGRVNCSKKNALAGIISVAQFIHQQRPRATLFVHGLLPRNEQFGDGNYTTGVKWQKLQWINQELQRFCRSQPKNQWFYLDNSQLFLRDDDPTRINAILMEDALHPTVEGYRRWALLLVKQISAVLGG